MSGWDLDDSQIKVLDIWLSVRPRNESNTIDPSSSSDVLTATDKFIAYLTSQSGAQADEFDDFSNRFANLEHALIEFCLLHPRSMDWGITVFFQVINNVPNDARCELGKGPEGARLDFERFLGNYIDLYYDRTRQFSSEEVKQRPDDIIQKMKYSRKRRWKNMITQCFSARCHALEVPARPNNKYLDQRLLTFIELNSDLARPHWNQVDCIGIMTILRGSASYLLSILPEEEQEEKKHEWIQQLNTLLYTIGERREVGDKADDFHIKAHAAVGIQYRA